MQPEWIFIGIFLAIGLVFPAVPIILAYFISPHKSNAIKNDSYECGIETVGDAFLYGV
jgi:NADH:ubiquinone oxidoreductase subunit 3 (subunit A)